MASNDAGTELETAAGDRSVSTASATASSGRRTSDPFNAEPNRLELPSHVEAVELLALRQELVHLRCELEQRADRNDVDPVDDVVAAAASLQSDASEFRVLRLDGGVYRGQARLSEATGWIPHGLGVLTAEVHTLLGQWLDGEQVGPGAIYSSTLHYEGDFGTGRCYGVGLYTFGALFAGCWRHDTAGSPSIPLYPQGLGRLQHTANIGGWFNGLHCVHSTASEIDDDHFNVSADTRSQSQPARGLLVADEKLLFWRRRALVTAMSRWSRLCCEFAASKANCNRLQALKTVHAARLAEQRAIHDDIEAHKALKSQQEAELLAQLAKAQDAQERRMQRRKLHSQRLTRAIEQRDLAQACVAKQQTAISILEVELQEVVELLNESRLAQENCALHARELHVLKRQIENASVKLNAARFGDRRTEDHAKTNNSSESEPSFTQRSVPPTPIKKTPRQREDVRAAGLHSRGGCSHRAGAPAQQFVCDVPGCSCGIPRDVFLRVAAALKDE